MTVKAVRELYSQRLDELGTARGKALDRDGEVWVDCPAIDVLEGGSER
jgi:hypothetical protein